MLKIRIIATFITLFAFIFTYLHATPVRRAGSKSAVAVLKKLNGTVKIEQLDKSDISVSGVFNKGFDDKNPDIYFIDFDGSILVFSDLNITIVPPGTDPWNVTYPGDVNDVLDTLFTVTKHNKVIDQATVVKA
ncbi:hypothetical protein F8M41_004928 [Gigaspora margarita]|uniref:Uncharacterized protein n=1 Tax=Gigaspora margarita TaxID=4874 RepID=A0A8H3XA80_GIGMA|nr:hypothetical protein F8M41_004928 [Gigaspora margarita]